MAVISPPANGIANVTLTPQNNYSMPANASLVLQLYDVPTLSSPGNTNITIYWSDPQQGQQSGKPAENGLWTSPPLTYDTINNQKIYNNMLLPIDIIQCYRASLEKEAGLTFSDIEWNRNMAACLIHQAISATAS